MKKHLLLIFYLFHASTIVLGQQKKIIKGNQQWFQLYNRTQLSKNVTFTIDGGYRWKDMLSHSSQYIAETGLLYQVNPGWSIGAGFVHMGYYQANKLSRVEFRPYQEAILKLKPKRIEYSNRFRLEERIFRKVIDGKISSEGTFNFRFYYGFYCVIPLVKLSASNPDCQLLLNIGDEIYINAGKEIVSNIFDQNRLLTGPAFQWNKNMMLTLIWNNQFAGTTAPGLYNYNSILWIGFRHKLDLTKKEKAN